LADKLGAFQHRNWRLGKPDMVAALGLPGKQGIEGHHVLHLDRMHPKADGNGLYRGIIDAAELALHRVGDVQQPASITREVRDEISHLGSPRRCHPRMIADQKRHASLGNYSDRAGRGPE
jgi:hypothetical protein